MSQIVFGHGVTEFKQRPDMRESFSGTVIQIPRNLAIDKEPPRRDDRLVPRFGGGTPTANSAEVDDWGVSSDRDNRKSLSYELAQTCEGSVKLPAESHRLQYTPSIDTLDFLTHSQGSRLQPSPARFFR